MKRSRFLEAQIAKLLGVGLSTFYRQFPASERPEPA